MYDTLLNTVRSGCPFDIQGVAILREDMVVIPQGNGELVPVVLSDNITCYIRTSQRARYDPSGQEMAGLYNLTEEMCLVFFQVREKYTMDSLIQYLRAQLGGVSGVKIREHYTDKEVILKEEKFINNDALFLKINFSYEYIASIKDCVGLQCVC